MFGIEGHSDGIRRVLGRYQRCNYLAVNADSVVRQPNRRSPKRERGRRRPRSRFGLRRTATFGLDDHYGNSPTVGTFDVQRPISFPLASNRINVGVTLALRRSAYSLFTLLNVKFTRMMRPLFHSPVSLLTAGI